MNINTIEGDLIEVSLRQLGASKVDAIRSDMYWVDFELGEDLLVSYVFNITSQDKYFLQRTRPYAFIHGKFAGEREIVAFITKDLEKFQNAARSRNYSIFIKEAGQIGKINEHMEDLFLNYNVDRVLLEDLGKRISGISDEIERVRGLSSKL